MSRVLLTLIAIAIAIAVDPAVAEIEMSDLTDALRADADDLPELARDLGRSVAMDGDDADDWRDLGIVRARLGRGEEALEALDRARDIEGGEEDVWARAYRAIALEGAGRVDEAAAAYRDLDLDDDEIREDLNARADFLLLRAAAATPDEASVAVLPFDVNGDDEAGSVFGAAVADAAGAWGLPVLGPAATRALFERDERTVDELNDPSGRIRVAVTLDRQGIRWLVTGTVVPVEDGTVYVAAALLPVGERDLGQTITVNTESKTGTELDVVEPIVASLFEQMGRETGDSTAIARVVPRSAAAMRAWMQARRAIIDGELDVASEALNGVDDLPPRVADLRAAIETVGASMDRRLVKRIDAPDHVARKIANHADATARKLKKRRR